jgi:hypothetical protein
MKAKTGMIYHVINDTKGANDHKNWLMPRDFPFSSGELLTDKLYLLMFSQAQALPTILTYTTPSDTVWPKDVRFGGLSTRHAPCRRNPQNPLLWNGIGISILNAFTYNTAPVQSIRRQDSSNTAPVQSIRRQDSSNTAPVQSIRRQDSSKCASPQDSHQSCKKFQKIRPFEGSR